MEQSHIGHQSKRVEMSYFPLRLSGSIPKEGVTFNIGHTAMTEERYWKEFQELQNQVYAASDAFNTHVLINELALENPNLLKKINRSAAFWKLTTYSLQTTCFIVLSRIFDHSLGAYSIHKLLNDTYDHYELFSKQALRARKSTDPSSTTWIDGYMSSVQEPRKDDVRKLQRMLRSHSNRFEKVLRPIRNKVFAHSLTVDFEEISALFSEVQLRDIDHMLGALNLLIDLIWNLYMNGHRPDLRRRSQHYKKRKRDLRTSLGSLLSGLP